MRKLYMYNESMMSLELPSNNIYKKKYTSYSSQNCKLKENKKQKKKYLPKTGVFSSSVQFASFLYEDITGFGKYAVRSPNSSISNFTFLVVSQES